MRTPVDFAVAILRLPELNKMHAGHAELGQYRAVRMIIQPAFAR
jgi:hypothetical protein